MTTPFQRQKNVHYFNMLDADQNGFVEQADFAEIGQRFAVAMGFKAGEAGYDQVCAGVLESGRRCSPTRTRTATTA